MFIIFDSYVSSFHHIIGYALVTGAIKYYILSSYFKEKQLKREIPVLANDHTIEAQLTPSEVTPELTIQIKCQMEHNKSTPKDDSENICNVLNTEAQFSPLEKSNSRILKYNRERRQNTPPVVHSVVVYKICVALNLDAQLCPLKNGCASITDMLQKTETKKYIPTVNSIFIYKICRALDLQAVLASPLKQ
ncbi:hypothetical protein NPIL_499171 [Nephila pilipes]|uniref:Uncharacterized protein n=1 Tax=Nephila pilipes TaxID=299642 RepID=A0A8X6N2Y6_NEPPI|nr:hypothetical protein NPIL_499171 [Nephila pilipes]